MSRITKETAGSQYIGRVLRRFLILLLFVCLPHPLSAAISDIWVDPANGSDSNRGASRTSALRTLTEAWQRIPAGTQLTDGIRVQLVAGTYARESMPTYFERRYGSSDAPIIIQAADASRSAHLQGDFNIFDALSLATGLDVTPEPAGDAFHCEQCDSVTLSDCLFDGRGVAQEAIKVNQSQHITIELSTVRGAWDNSIDFVAVQYARIAGNDISNAGDWCAYTKGGSAYITVEENEIHQCGTGGFTAGQGSGLQFMSLPWVHYEAYDIKVLNNIIHDTEERQSNWRVHIRWRTTLPAHTHALAHDRSRVRSAKLRRPAGRPGTRERCQQYLDAGAWGTTAVDDGT